MQIALLRPDSPETPEGRLGAELARGLEGCGLDVTSYRVPPTPLGEVQAIAELFGRAREFDLIHNLIGPRPLAFASFVPVPILSTLRRTHSFEELALMSRYRDLTWYVGGEYESPHELECVAVIHTPDAALSPEGRARLADEYQVVYRRVLEAHAVRRADHQHDRRPWGQYWVLEDDPRFKVKRIDVLPGARLSYQRHKRRAEHWVIVGGRAVVTLDDVEHELGEGQSIDIPIGAAHRVANPGPELLSFVEVQSGTYFGEDDIERLQDDFGRLEGS